MGPWALGLRPLRRRADRGTGPGREGSSAAPRRSNHLARSTLKTAGATRIWVATPSRNVLLLRVAGLELALGGPRLDDLAARWLAKRIERDEWTEGAAAPASLPRPAPAALSPSSPPRRVPLGIDQAPSSFRARATARPAAATPRRAARHVAGTGEVPRFGQSHSDQRGTSKLRAFRGRPDLFKYADFGYGHNGRLRRGQGPTRRPDRRGGLSLSTQSTTALSMSKVSSVAGPPPQWPIPAPERAGPGGDGGRPAVRLRHPLVVLDRVQGGEPGVADAVVEEKLPALLEKVSRLVQLQVAVELHLRVGGGPLGTRRRSSRSR